MNKKTNKNPSKTKKLKLTAIKENASPVCYQDSPEVQADYFFPEPPLPVHKKRRASLKKKK